MIIFAGLGNPGEKYARTRHNIGFMAVDAIARAHGFSADRKAHQALVADGRLGTEKILIIKPQTYMNESGRAIGEAMRYYKCNPDEVIVFHDELDLVPGKIRLKTGGGHAGHNGLRSMHEHIGPDYRRVRLGIGHPGDKSKVSGYVLHDFAKADQDWLNPLIDAIAAHASLLATGDTSRFQSNVAQDLLPSSGAAKSVDVSLTETSSAKLRKEQPKDPSREPAGPFDTLKRLLGQ